MKKYRVKIDDQEYIVELEEIKGDREQSPPSPSRTSVPEDREKSVTPREDNKKDNSPRENVNRGEITAPMPGKILDIQINEGQEVARGDILLILEAMKLENNITAPFSGTVKSIDVGAGASVEAGAVLVKLEQGEDHGR